MVSDAHGLSSDDIQKYLQRICDEAGGLMRDYDPGALLEWTDTNIADGTCFQVDIRIQKDGVHTGSIAMTLKKEDALQLGGLFGASVNKKNIVDYSLDVTVRDVTIHGTDAATVKVTWREQLIVQGPAREGHEERGRFTLDAEADCVHLIVRENGRLALGMALCSGMARLDVSGV